MQLECINCGLCMDACDHVMAKLQRDAGLITWDTLARQAARQAGQTPAPIRLLRPRTLVYATALLLAARGHGDGLGDAADAVDLGRARPRAAVRPAAGRRHPQRLHLRVLNKAHGAARFELASPGCPAPCWRSPEGGPPPAATLLLPVDADQVGTFRVLGHGGVGARLGPGRVRAARRRDGRVAPASRLSFMGPAR